MKVHDPLCNLKPAKHLFKNKHAFTFTFTLKMIYITICRLTTKERVGGSTKYINVFWMISENLILLSHLFHGTLSNFEDWL